VVGETAPKRVGAVVDFGRGDMAALAEVMADDIEWVDPEAPANEGQSADVSGVDLG
jgi:ketosteroid isomerase-like protein